MAPDSAEPPKSFEWINVEDSNAAQKVKGHAIREYRRKQKAAGASFQKRKDNAGKRTILLAGAVNAGGEKFKKTQRSLPMVARGAESKDKLGARLGGCVDPFNLFPAQLNARRDASLAHHCEPMPFP